MEFTTPEEPPLDDPNAPDLQWQLYVDGSSNAKCSGAGVVLITPEKRAISYALRLNFPATNNDAEHEALIAGLKIAIEFNLKTIQIFSDSQLIVRQVLGEYRAIGP